MHILIVEDDATLRQMIADRLAQQGYTVALAGNGLDGLRLAYQKPPDLVLLDVMMPGMDGWATCARLRELSEVPIIMVTALGQEEDVVRGLQLGADDYVRKPLSLAELEARIEALLRRKRPEATVGASYDDGRLRIEPVHRLVLRDGAPVHLTPTEFRLLSHLVERRDTPVTHRQLLAAVWGPEYADDTANLSVYIRYLREKIEDDPREPRYLQTVWGVGYRFTSAVTPASS